MLKIPLPRRLRLIKLLRAHGLRDLERLREDELQQTLDRMPFIAGEPEAAPPSPVETLQHGAPSSASSAALARADSRLEDSDLPEVKPEPVFDRSAFDDPDALPFFREPPMRLPEGERTFLRLVAVDPRIVFVTWDMSAETRRHIKGGVQLWLRVLDDDGTAPLVEDIDLFPGRRYLPAPGERKVILAELRSKDDGALLAISNSAIVPPSKPAPAGPLVYATLSPRVDRRVLAERGLLDRESGELPHGIALAAAGEARGGRLAEASGVPSSAERLAHADEVRSSHVEIRRVKGEIEAEAKVPSSHSLPSSRTMPSSHSRASSHSLPSSHHGRA